MSQNKREDILRAAQDLFWKHGFKRVSIEEICKNASVSKMTYYKFFSNKIDLAKTVFNYVVEDGERKLKQIFRDDTPASEKLKKIIMLKIEGTNNIGPEFLKDFYQGTEPELKAYVEQRTRQAWNLLLDDFREAQKKGIFRKDFKPELLISIQNKLVEVLEDENLKKMYNSQQELFLDLTNLLIYGIAQHN